MFHSSSEVGDLAFPHCVRLSTDTNTKLLANVIWPSELITETRRFQQAATRVARKYVPLHVSLR